MLYLVEAQFQTYDYYYEQIVGIFDDIKLAEYHKNKWLYFFKLKYEEIFKEFDKSSIRNNDGDWISDEVENEYYRRKAEHSLIFDFRNITIHTLKLNEDWIKMYYVRTESQSKLMNQFSIEYNREYNLNKLIDE
jgi:hypothetical protein